MTTTKPPTEPPGGVEALVGRDTGWQPFDCEAWRAERLLAASGLTDPAYHPRPGATHPPLVPPTYPVAVRLDTEALGIPDAPSRLNGGNTIRWLEPARLGERLQRRTTITSVDTKDGRSGRLVFYTLESTFRRPDTERIVATTRNITIRRYPNPDSGVGTGSRSPKQAGEDEKLPVLLKVTPTTRDLVRYAAGSDDYYEVHYDEPFARRTGLPGVISHGLLKLAWFARAALEWAGPGAVLRELSGSYRGVDLVGREFTVHGGPSDPRAEDGPGGTTALTLVGRSADGAVTTSGHAVVDVSERA
ncbi:FAS1-like dehydratase domain-containing protein [Pseudonocardia acaciae]|uniref:FAS1-like dehydratase domain-containing protein n=1 Tax=Pseudonocardia acaciae TaxID=551276 RepID=UPI0006847B61|nr:MaoC family dehydratase N-terminal domain-containing protein [Pseudonocardia acaciae]